MYKFLATRGPKSNICPVRKDWCEAACDRCEDCSPETRTWDGCWSACDECNRCHQRGKRSEFYNDPYNYMFPWYQRKLSETPLAKQFCSNVCGVNMCRAYRQRYDGYAQCRRCKQKGQCWSQYQNQCVPCSESQLMKSCEEKWGCPNPNGSQFGFVPPRDPMYTDCIPCWNPVGYTT